MAERLWTVYLEQEQSRVQSSQTIEMVERPNLHLSAAVESEAKDWAGEGKLNCLAEGNPETVALTSLTLPLQFFRIPFRLRLGEIGSSDGEEEGGDLCSATLDTSNLLGLRSVFGTDIRARS